MQLEQWDEEWVTFVSCIVRFIKQDLRESQEGPEDELTADQWIDVARHVKAVSGAWFDQRRASLPVKKRCV